MPEVAQFDVGININTQGAESKLNTFLNKQRTINLNDKISQQLSAITRGVNEFDTSLQRATNRVFAFAAAGAVLIQTQKAFALFVKSTIDIEDSLAKVQVNLNETTDGLKKFGADLFNVARQTGKGFEETAKAAEEFARQGLGAEETIRRTRDALILSRIAAIDTKDAVNDLTGAVNSYAKEALTTTDILNKFVALDTRFAVSSKDLADSLQRAGSVAADAGLSLDKFLGIVTAVKQTTGRDGATIGNGLKTIFERTRQPTTLKDFQELGIAVKNFKGEVLPVDQILKNLAKSYDTLSQAQQQQISKSVANIQQINVFKALLNDLTKSYSISSEAAEISANATDEAIQKNIALNKTLKSAIQNTQTTIEQFFSTLGSQDVTPLLKSVLDNFEKMRSFLSGDSGSKLGESLGTGLLKGISNIINGPLLIGVTAVLGRAFGKVVSVISKDIQGLLGINSIVSQQAEIQEKLNILLKNATTEQKEQIAAATTLLEREQAILTVYKEQSLLRKESGLVNSLVSLGGGRPSNKFIPNAADPVNSAIQRELNMGVPKNLIYIDSDQRLVTSDNPQGLLVANRRDEPVGGFQGVNRILSQGGDPRKAGKSGSGIPNLANFNNDFDINNRYDSSNPVRKKLKINYKGEGYPTYKDPENINIHGSFDEKHYRVRTAYNYPIGPQQPASFGPFPPKKPTSLLGDNLIEDAVSYDTNLSSIQNHTKDQTETAQALQNTREYTSAKNAERVEQSKLKADQLIKDAKDKQINRRKFLEKASFGLLLAAPLAAGFIPEGQGGTVAGKLGGAASGALNGAGIGAILGPEGAAAGAVIGAIVGAFQKANKSIEEFSKTLDDATAEQQKNINAAGNVSELDSRIDETSKNGDPRALKRLNEQRLSALQSITDSSVRDRVSKGFANDDERTEYIDSLSKQSAVDKNQNSVKKLAFLSGQPSLLNKAANFIDSNPLGKVGTGILFGGQNTDSLRGLDKIVKNLFPSSFQEEEKNRQVISQTIAQTISSKNANGIDKKGLNGILLQDDASPASIKKVKDEFNKLGYEIDVNENNFKELTKGILDAEKSFRILESSNVKFTEKQAGIYLRYQQSQTLENSQGLFSTSRQGALTRGGIVDQGRSQIAALRLSGSTLSNFNEATDIGSLEAKRRSGLSDLDAQFTQKLKSKALAGSLDSQQASSIGGAGGFGELSALLKHNGQKAISENEVSTTARELADSQKRLNHEIDDAIKTRKQSTAIEKLVANAQREQGAFRGQGLGGNPVVSSIGASLRSGGYNRRTSNLAAVQTALSVQADKELEGLDDGSDPARQARRVKNDAQNRLNSGYDVGAKFLEQRLYGARFRNGQTIFKEGVERSLTHIKDDKAFDQDTRDKASDILSGITSAKKSRDNPTQPPKQDQFAELKSINDEQAKLIKETSDLYEKLAKEIATGNRDILTNIKGEITLDSNVLAPDVLDGLKKEISESISNVINQRLKELNNKIDANNGRPNPPSSDSD